MQRRPGNRLVILVLLLLLAMAGAGYLAGSWNCKPAVATGPAKSNDRAADGKAAAAALAMARDEAAMDPKTRIERKYDRLLAARRKERYERACDASAERTAGEACRNVERLIGELRGSRAKELAALETKSRTAVTGKKARPRLPKRAIRAPRKKPDAPRKRKSAIKKNTKPTGGEKPPAASAPVEPSAPPNKQLAAIDTDRAVPSAVKAGSYDGEWVGEWSTVFISSGMAYCESIAKSTLTIRNGKVSGRLDNGQGDLKVTGVVKSDGSFYLDAVHWAHDFTANGKFEGDRAEGEFEQTFCGGTVVYRRKLAAAHAKPADTGKTRAARQPGKASLTPEKQLAAVDTDRAIPDEGEAGPFDGAWVGEWSAVFEYTGGGTYCETTAKSTIAIKNGKISGWLINGEEDQKITGAVKEDGSFHMFAEHALIGYSAHGTFKGNKMEGEFDRTFCGGNVEYRRKPDQQGR